MQNSDTGPDTPETLVAAMAMIGILMRELKITHRVFENGELDAATKRDVVMIFGRASQPSEHTRVTVGSRHDFENKLIG